MATITGNYVFDNSSLTNFKNWAQAISSAFSTLGWVQTTDTGQVNWSTIAAVPSSAYVFEIWKSADTLSTTLPIFVKVWYGFTATIPRLQMTIGTGSDGAGNIVGQVTTGSPWTLTTLTTNQGSTVFPCFFSGSPGEFRMWMWGTVNASPATGVLVVIERSKDSNGNSTSDYFTTAWAVQNNSGLLSYQQTIMQTGVGNRDSGIITIGLTSGSGTGSAFGTVAAFPVFPLIGKIGNPMLGLMSACAGDASPNSTVTVSSMYGTTHTYLTVGGTSSSGITNAFGARASTGAPMQGLMRFE